MIGVLGTHTSGHHRELPAPLRERPLLLLEPHLDDAALSCAALLAREAPIDVFAVLVGRPDPPQQGSWDRLTGFASSDESIAARIEEEQTALADTPHRLALGDLLEGQYLNGGRRRREDAGALASAIWNWLDLAGRGIVAVPAGAGSPLRRTDRVLRRLGASTASPLQHPDHLFVRDAAVEALDARSDGQILFYEEFPYRWGSPADREIDRIARSRRRPLEAITIMVDRRVKADRIRKYASQVAYLTIRGRDIASSTHLPVDERYWLLV